MFPMDYILFKEIVQIVWLPCCFWQSKIHFLFIATEDVVKVLEGGSQSEAEAEIETWLDKVGLMSSSFSKGSVFHCLHSVVKCYYRVDERAEKKPQQNASDKLTIVMWTGSLPTRRHFQPHCLIMFRQKSWSMKITTPCQASLNPEMF